MTAPALNRAVQGLNSISGDNLNTYGQTCNSVDDLRGFIGAAGMQVFMRGFVSLNDGGQGNFAWVVGGTGPDDDGVNYIVPEGSSEGCWARVSNPGVIYTVATVPPAAAHTGNVIYVSNGDSGSPCIAVSNGSAWKRIALGATIST